MPDPPIQPFAPRREFYPRFRANAIVEHLLKVASDHGTDLNTLARMEFPQADREQFYMLIGYSLGGFAELSYVSQETYDRAVEAARDAGYDVP